MENNHPSRMIQPGDTANAGEQFSPMLPLALRAAPVFTWEQAVRVLRKNRRFILVFAAVASLSIAAVAFLIRDVYQPTARLEIDPPGSGIKTLQEIESSYELDSQNYLETQAQILRSDALAVSVIRALHLDANREFVTKGEVAKFSQRQDLPALPLKPSGENEYLQEQFNLSERTPLESIALLAFQKRISVNAIRNSRLIEVSCASHNPELARLITNTLVTQFMDQNYRNRYTTTMEASEWLSGQLGDLRQKVEESNQAVTDYMRQYGLVTTNDDRDIPQSQLMDDVNHQLSDAQANRIEAEAYIRMIDTGQSDAIPAVRDDQLYQNLMTHYVDVRAQLAQARAVYGDENSNVKKLEDGSNELATQVEAERTRMVNQVRTSFAAAHAREQMMLSAREKVRAEMGETSSHLATYRVLKTEASANADLYNTLQARLKEAGIYAGLRSSNIHIVDLAATLPKPTGPHRGFIITVGAILSCVFALMLAFVRESFSNTVRTPDDIRDWTGLPSLAMLPPINGAKPRHDSQPTGSLVGTQRPEIWRPRLAGILSTPSNSAEAEAMHNLSAALSSQPKAPPRVVLVSSPASGEGKTTVAINLALAFAQRGTTCLIDCDLRRAGIANVFGLQDQAGLGQVLASFRSIDDVVSKVPDLPNLSVIPAGTLLANPADLVASQQMRDLLVAARARFDHVVVDSPPLIPFSDARVLSSLADFVVLVGRYGLTTRRALERSAQLLDEARAPMVGVVLNDISLDSADYQYFNYGFSKTLNAKDYYRPNHKPSSSPPPPKPAGGEVKKRSTHA